jgi:hypothetical protein
MDDGLGAGLGLPAIGNDENLGHGKGRARHCPFSGLGICRPGISRFGISRFGISVTAETGLRPIRGGSLSVQDLVAGRWGNPS